MEKESKLSLSAYQLKLIAIIAMLIDHLAWTFIRTPSFEGQVLHMIGRLTAPIMCFFVAEGFFYTHNLKKYFMRMGIFAVISAVAYSFYESGGRFRYNGLGMIYTLFLGLLAVTVWYRLDVKKWIKVCLIIAICMMSFLGDWMVMGVLFTFYFAIYRNEPKKKYSAFAIIVVVESSLATISQVVMNPSRWWSMCFQFGALLAIPLLQQYHGRLGGNRNLKWIFYVFYPLHLIIIGIIASNIH